MHKLNTITALSLSVILIFSMISVSNAQLDDEEIVKVRVKQGKTLVMLLVKSSEDFGLDIYQFKVKLTNGNVKGFKAPKMWTGERDSSDPNSINFSTEEKPIPAGKGASFRLRVDAQNPVFDWTAFDEDGEEIDSGTAEAKRRGPSERAQPTPVPVPPVTKETRGRSAIDVSPIGSTQYKAGIDVQIFGKGFAPNSAVKIMFDEREWANVETSADGTFTTKAVIPDDARPGDHKVWATDSAGNSASVGIFLAKEGVEPTPVPEPAVRGLGVKTESDHYSQGDTVVIVGRGIPNGTVELQVTDPTGKVVFREKASTDSNGMFGVKMPLGADAQSGTYVVYAKQEGQEAKSRFMVMSREKPMPMPPASTVLTVNTEHERYHDGESVVIFGRASSGIVGIAVMYGETTSVAGSMVFKGEAKVSMDGSYKTMFTLKNAKEGIYIVMAQQGGASASTKFFVGPSEKGEQFGGDKYSGELKVDTDKDSYTTGEMVTIFGANADPKNEVGLVIFYSSDSGDRAVHKVVLMPTSDGSFKAMYRLMDAKPGVYTVVAMQDGSSAKAQFKIET